MNKSKLLISDGLSFDNNEQVLTHISQTLIDKQIVAASHLNALQDREKIFPTGIAFADYAVAIPHCEAEHALAPAIYLLRLKNSVAFNRADDDSMVDVNLVMGLVVTDPADQLTLLRTLFTRLQDKVFYEFLLNSSSDEIHARFNQDIFSQA
ncbi:PTS system galactitol-specific EIIA component (Gat family) [Orbus hercynius]|uniref:PTS system galactitol-specific EIIA component (Gat family) n=1 Tax=Orbus hercynius TaxID=593135 RepID=A0A495RBC3_9GAMM|nr:PTS galactitol transporter subunit IIA [Orbus hercynius]RKS84787.1 PTS system galactitol-specific EIIA component (Gat family) [Orbus hercynius]